MRAGIIGIGKLGSIHLRILKEITAIKNIILVDIDKEKLAPHKEKNFTDYRKIKDLVDFVIVSSPTSTHFEIARFFLRHRIPVLVEKPITAALTQAKALLSLSRKTKTLLFVGHVERYNNAYLSAKKLIRHPKFIECHRLSPFPHRSLDIGVVTDLMIHDLDIILDIVKDDIKTIEAVGVKVLSPYEDIANARLTFHCGCIANITASRISKEQMRKFRVFAHNCYVSLDYVHQEVELYRKTKKSILKKKLLITKVEPLKQEVADFVTMVQRNNFSLFSSEKATRALALALKIENLIGKTL